MHCFQRREHEAEVEQGTFPFYLHIYRTYKDSTRTQWALSPLSPTPRGMSPYQARKGMEASSVPLSLPLPTIVLVAVLIYSQAIGWLAGLGARAYWTGGSTRGLGTCEI